MSPRRSTVLVLLTVLAAIPGCAAGGAEPVPHELTETQASALIDEGGATATPGYPNVTLGLISQQTCFLQGIGGDLRGTPTTWPNPMTENPAGAWVTPSSDGHWHLQVFKGTGTGVSAEAVCIDSKINFHEMNAYAAPAGSPEAIATYTGGPNTQCFLRSIYAEGALSHPADQLALTKTVGSNGVPTWTLRADSIVVAGADTVGGVGAYCVDLPGTYAQDFNNLYSSPYVLTNWVITSAPVNSGTVCGLTGLLGDWTWVNYDGNHPEPFGVSDGVFLHNWINGSFLPYWSAYVTNTRRGHITCRTP